MCLFFSFSLTVGYRMKLLFSAKASIRLPLKAGGEEIFTIFPLILLSLLSLRGGFLENLENFFSSKSLIRDEKRKWNFFFLIRFGIRSLFLFKLNRSFLTFSFSSFRLLYFFFLNKFTKFLRDGLGEKILLLFILKKNRLIEWDLTSLSNSFREKCKIFSNIFSLFSLLIIIFFFLRIF